MSISLHEMSQSTSSGFDQGILNEIQQAHRYRVFVQHRGRWISGCQFASLERARHTAGLAYRRSELPTEVRDYDGTVLFELRPGIDVESLLDDFNTGHRIEDR